MKKIFQMIAAFYICTIPLCIVSTTEEQACPVINFDAKTEIENNINNDPNKKDLYDFAKYQEEIKRFEPFFLKIKTFYNEVN